MILLADSKGPDQTARTLIWAFAVRICQKSRFHMVNPISNSIDYHSGNQYISNLIVLLCSSEKNAVYSKINTVKLVKWLTHLMHGISKKGALTNSTDTE